MSRPTRGQFSASLSVSTTGLSPSLAGLPMPFVYADSPLWNLCMAPTNCPTTPIPHRLHAVSRNWFRLFPVRSPLLGKSRLFSFPRGTEMFQFPRCPPCNLCIQLPVSFLRKRGSPIRKSSDLRLRTAPRGISVFAPSFFGT